MQRQQTSNSTFQQMDSDDPLKNLIHFQPTSVAHLMALISHPPSTFPPPNTGLIVLDSISCLFGSEFRTRMPDPATAASRSNAATKKAKNATAEREDRESKLRWKLIGEIVGSLKRLAVLSECAVITVNEMVSRFRPGQSPVLHEAISGVTWDAGVSTRILAYWQWLPASVWEKVRMKKVRVAEVAKVAGTLCGERKSDRIVSFVINDVSLLGEFCSRIRGTNGVSGGDIGVHTSTCSAPFGYSISWASGGKETEDGRTGQ